RSAQAVRPAILRISAEDTAKDSTDESTAEAAAAAATIATVRPAAHRSRAVTSSAHCDAADNPNDHKQHNRDDGDRETQSHAEESPALWRRRRRHGEAR